LGSFGVFVTKYYRISGTATSSLDISKLQTPLAHPSYLYDQKGNRISELSSSRIEPVTGQQIPLIMKKAIIAVEDRRY